jgi:hypothetical protein
VACWRAATPTELESGPLSALGGSRTANLLIRRPTKALVRACFFVTSDTAELAFRPSTADGPTRAITPQNGPKSSEPIHLGYHERTGDRPGADAAIPNHPRSETSRAPRLRRNENNLLCRSRKVDAAAARSVRQLAHRVDRTTRSGGRRYGYRTLIEPADHFRAALLGEPTLLLRRD